MDAHYAPVLLGICAALIPALLAVVGLFFMRLLVRFDLVGEKVEVIGTTQKLVLLRLDAIGNDLMKTVALRTEVEVLKIELLRLKNKRGNGKYVEN